MNRTDKIKSLFKALQKQIKYSIKPAKKKVLEHLIYAACLENASFEAADAAFAVLTHHYIDWNEIRVSTAKEIADTFPKHPEPFAAGERIHKTLQSVFETMYVFDLEDLAKKNIAQSMGYLKSIPACSRFMSDYTNLMAFGGHVIPLCELSLRIFRLLDLTHVDSDKTKETVPAIERAIAKTQGLQSFMLLHQFAAEHAKNSDSPILHNLLNSIDSNSAARSFEPPTLETPKERHKNNTRPFPSSKDVFKTIVDDDFDASDDFSVSAHIDFVTPPTEQMPQPTKEIKQKNSDKSTKTNRKSPPDVSVNPQAETPKKPKSAKKTHDPNGGSINDKTVKSPEAPSPTKKLQKKKPR